MCMCPGTRVSAELCLLTALNLVPWAWFSLLLTCCAPASGSFCPGSCSDLSPAPLQLPEGNELVLIGQFFFCLRSQVTVQA